MCDLSIILFELPQYLRFINRDDAKDAFDDQNGRIHDGRRITIEWSRKDDGHERRAEKARGRTRSRTRAGIGCTSN